MTTTAWARIVVYENNVIRTRVSNGTVKVSVRNLIILVIY